MAKGKYYSLEEARKKNDLEGFAKAHPTKGDRALFNDLLNRMAKNLPVSGRTSKKG